MKLERPMPAYRDPVCGMKVSFDTTAASADYRSRTYYFCAHVCRNAFESDPENYLKNGARGQPRWEAAYWCG